VSSIKDRQRAAARARLEKEMAERAAAARRRRQRLVIASAGLALLLVVGGTIWLVATLGDDGENTSAAPAQAPGTTSCFWNTDGPASPKTKDVGLPPTSVPNVGTRVMTIDTNVGPIETQLDLSKVPCTAASFTHLASKRFFDGSKCHRLVTSGIKVLQCGDPSARGKGYRPSDGTGGPSYRFAEENKPIDQRPTYPEGVIAMAKTQEPASTGSQFFIVYGDSELPADYTILGKVTKGMDLVKKAAAAGHAKGAQNGDGNPKTEVVIKSLKVA
jgi:peptidyl-prolyl cis-trans isomerase B (cyclophilin B)